MNNQNFKFEMNNIESELENCINAARALFENIEDATIIITITNKTEDLAYPLSLLEKSTKEKFGRLLLKDITKRGEKNKKLQKRGRIIKEILKIILR